jgi:hypothetical protein
MLVVYVQNVDNMLLGKLCSLNGIRYLFHAGFNFPIEPGENNVVKQMEYKINLLAGEMALTFISPPVSENDKRIISNAKKFIRLNKKEYLIYD